MTTPTLMDLTQALRRVGSDWADLKRSCDQIILFGSRAAGRVEPGSDWDLLCIGEGSSRLGDVDLIWLSPFALERADWVHGELASHIAAHGLWLHGEDRWTHRCELGAQAARRKAQYLARQMRTLEKYWLRLSPFFQLRHALQLRRDLQRYLLLAAHQPIPCRPVLDDQWSLTSPTPALLLDWAEHGGVMSEFFRSSIIPTLIPSAADA